MARQSSDAESGGEPDREAPERYEALLDRYRRIAYLESGSGVLYWDQQVTMPEGGTPARGKQLAALSATTHEKLTSDGMAEAIADAEDADLSEAEAANVREIRRRHDRNRSVPESLVEELTEHTSNSQRVWQEAKAEDDFDRFAPALETLRDLQVRRAEAIDPDRPPYEVMYEDGEPYLPLDRMAEIFEELKDALVPLIEEIQAEGDDLPSPFVEAGPYADEEQRALSDAVLDLLGYPEEHGRLDVSAHPFTAGNQYDARITTRFKPDDPMDALTATVHEFGHASYELGLPTERFGEPLGASLSSGVHESQSRFWENHVGRTKPFWEGFLPTAKEHLDGIDDVTPEEAYAAVNRIYPENLIRVEADELTYHLHIILRCELDRAFVAGDLAVEELPDAWNRKMEEYLDVTPDTDAVGVLQDIHWSSRFAAFQGYTIGSVLAAQLDHAMRRDVDDVDAKIREGDLKPLRDWMTEHVHSHGRRYPTDELVEEATGEPLTAEYFVDYVEEKFGALYGL
ncbi:carboxypeptidase M32 [Halorarum halobium]|uniref:carboxypeptidase M32 n=1 Tax=Halorarum halobium TaxID=3075121 RepID=UPI0028A88C12|nr:carboxypeptidase M32 [Halobaculum sp. XH14]